MVVRCVFVVCRFIGLLSLVVICFVWLVSVVFALLCACCDCVGWFTVGICDVIWVLFDLVWVAWFVCCLLGVLLD